MVFAADKNNDGAIECIQSRTIIDCYLFLVVLFYYFIHYTILWTDSYIIALQTPPNKFWFRTIKVFGIILVSDPGYMTLFWVGIRLESLQGKPSYRKKIYFIGIFAIFTLHIIFNIFRKFILPYIHF